MSARASLPSPSPEEVRAPVARACASSRPRERALSAARALAVLRHPPAPAPAAAPPPPPTFCRRRHSQPFPPLSSSVLAFCRSSGKRRNSEIRSPSAPVHHPPAAPRPRDGFRELGIRQAQRRGPLCALGATKLGENACKRYTHAGECVYLCVLGSSPSAPRKRGQGGACALRVGRGWL